MDLTLAIIIAVACLLVGILAGYLIFRYVIKDLYDTKMKEAEMEAETLKQNKLSEVKEKLQSKKAELEKEANQRNQKMQQQENKLKQRELALNQRNEELQSKQ